MNFKLRIVGVYISCCNYICSSPRGGTVSLSRGRIQEIKRMLLVNLMHGLFLTRTQESHYIYRSYLAIFTQYTIFPPNPTPCIPLDNPVVLTWRTSFFVCSDESPSTLVSGLLTTARPLTLPLSPFHTPQFKLHYLHNIFVWDRNDFMVFVTLSPP